MLHRTGNSRPDPGIRAAEVNVCFVFAAPPIPRLKVDPQLGKLIAYPQSTCFQVSEVLGMLVGDGDGLCETASSWRLLRWAQRG